MPVAEPGAAVRLSFVGSGPGDPRMLTLAAVDALRAADVVLVDPDVGVDFARDERLGLPERTRVQVVEGTTPEARVAEARAEAAAGHRVVRLCQGDPFLDGRARAEAGIGLAEGIEVDVVPGLPRRTVVAEFAGVDLSTGPVALVDVASLPVADAWSASATLVVTTRVELLPGIVEHALAHGRAASDLAVATLDGATTAQQSLRVPLAELNAAVTSEADADEQVTVVIGAGAAADPAPWFESKPLFGWRVLVPRTKEQSVSLVSRLQSHGARPEEVPTIAVEPPRQPQLVDKAVRALVEGSYEWVVFTSVNAVRAVRLKVEEYGLDARVFSGVRIAVVGNTTRKSLLDWGITPDLMPEGEHSAAGLAAEFPAHDDLLDPINKVFLPRADIAVDTLVTGLTELGWEVEDVTAYRTVRALPPPAPTREAIKTGDFDAVVFTSSSTVRNLVGIAGKPHACTIIAAIGPRTAETCTEHGLRVDVLATEPDAIVLADELSAFAARRRDEILATGKPVKKPSQRRRRRRAVPTEPTDAE